jgi:two-component system invasion response regulator UvrY
LIRVLIADDHTIVRRGVKQLLAVQPGVEVVAEASDGTEALNRLRENKVDVVILDISMPGRSGLDTLKELKRLYPTISVVVLSMHPLDQYAVRVLRAGALAYITKESAPEELLQAVQKAYRGGRYITADLAELLADYVEKGDTEEPHKLLTDREFEVMLMIASGKGVSEIARELNISVKTVSTYKGRIVEKTGLASNSEITRYSIERDLL